MSAVTAKLGLRQFSLLSVAVFAAILPHLSRLPWSLTLLLPILLFARWWQRRWRPTPVSVLLKLPLALLIVALTLMQYGNVFGREPGSALACGMLVLKLVESETARDARAAVLFAAFVLMSALLFAQSLFYTAFLMLVLILLLAVLRQLQAQPANSIAAWRPQLIHYLRDAGLSLLAGAPLALCAFLLIPRFTSPLWGAPNDGDSARTGLSDRMSPGDISNLLNDDSPAFRVGFTGAAPAPAKRYWRGPVLWNFDGRAWTRPEWADTAAPVTITSSGAMIDYDVTQEPSSQRWMLALDVPTDVPADATRFTDLTVSGRRRDTTNPRRYHLRSVMDYVLQPEISEPERRHALQLPRGFNPRSIALGQQLRAAHPDDDVAVVREVLQRFRNDYTYTQAPPGLGRESIDEFLFDTRAGFCEHYSSAFTFVMRAAGIPARVVTGYQGGYFSNVGRYLLVRQSDAHAWSEIWLPQRGWVRIDPTAEVSPSRIELGATATRGGDGESWYHPQWIASLRNQFDLANHWWNEAVVQFNALRQAGLLQPFGIEHADYGQLAWVLSGCISVILAGMTLWTLRRSRGVEDALDRSYVLLCRKLARAGLKRGASEGPRDFCERAATSIPESAAVIRGLTQRYVNLRYAHTLCDSAELHLFDRAVRTLRVSKRKP